MPTTPLEQIESTHAAHDTGSALVHIHVRDKDENPSSDLDLFARVREGVRLHCPDIIVQFSTGGRGRKPQERGASLCLKPDMASLTTGSVNFPNQIYENPADFIESLCCNMLEFAVNPEIEVFDAAMLYNAAELVKRDLIERPPHVQFVMVIPNATPARPTNPALRNQQPWSQPIAPTGAGTHNNAVLDNTVLVQSDQCLKIHVQE